MKKTLSIFLAIVLTFALAVPAFAADNAVNGEGSGSANQQVTATYDALVDDQNVATVYLVNVGWSVNSTLKYSDGTKTYTWNADQTKYTAATSDAGWTGEATVDITVTNKSNADIAATASWANAEGITAACTFTDAAAIDIESAAKDVAIADGAAGAAKTGAIQATVAAPTAGTISADNAPVGTITVNIAKKA